MNGIKQWIKDILNCRQNRLKLEKYHKANAELNKTYTQLHCRYDELKAGYQDLQVKYSRLRLSTMKPVTDFFYGNIEPSMDSHKTVDFDSAIFRYSVSIPRMRFSDPDLLEYVLFNHLDVFIAGLTDKLKAYFKDVIKQCA